MTKNANSTYSSAVTDSVMKVNEIVLGSAASTAMAAMYISMANAAGVGSQNTVSTQHHRSILATATLAAGAGNLLWSGLSQEVKGISIDQRLRHWEQMLRVSEGKEIDNEQSEAIDGKAEPQTNSAAEGQS